MKKSQKAFTLAELLVTIAVSSILLTMVVFTSSMISKVNKTSISTSQEAMYLSKVREYIQDNNIISADFLTYSDGELDYNGERIYFSMPFTNLSFSFYLDSTLNKTKCRMLYETDHGSGALDFIVC